MSSGGGDFSNFSMIDLFRTEIEGQVSAMTEGMLALEENPMAEDQLEALMRASHSIKGAARMVDVNAVVKISHIMEDCFVAAQKKELILNSEHTDILLNGIDMISRITEDREESFNEWSEKNQGEIDTLLAALETILSGNSRVPAEDSGSEVEEKKPLQPPKAEEALVASATNDAPIMQNKITEKSNKDRILRVSSERMDRLLGLAGETMVESRWTRTHLDAMLRQKRYQFELVSDLDNLREMLGERELGDQVNTLLVDLQHKATDYRDYLSEQLSNLEHYDHRSTNLASRLHNEVIASRMRPFSDGTEGLQRMVRDVARSLGKKVKLEFKGLATQVDRDVLEMLKAPLNHLLRNAVDHGIEMPEEREEKGKPAQGVITLSAYHRAGMLSVTVSDDGKGVDLDYLRSKIVKKGLANDEMVNQMSDMELLDFLFLPSFSTRDAVTEISGRGVGLDVVHDSVREMRGVVNATTTPGKGMKFHLQLPLTLSVVRTLLVEIGGECYALPLARIDHILKLPTNEVQILEDRQYMTWNGRHIGLIVAAQIFLVDNVMYDEDFLSIVLLSDRHTQYGIIVDRFLGERELAVQVLDPRLGKIKDIASAALLDDGAPALIIDVDDLVRSIDNLVAGERVNKIGKGVIHKDSNIKRQRILVVDDSITVREVQRNLLETCGYEVDVAVDGMDGWNTLRSGDYDLVITDVDMPRMDGIELVQYIKGEPDLKHLPVMIVSYKDREEDRQRGLEAGADCYLTKGSFHDESLREAVIDLIGEPH